MDTGKLLIGVLGGVAAGALLGILFATDKGKNTRKKIIKKGEAYSDSLKEKFEEFTDTLSEKAKDLKEEVSDLTEKLRTKAAEAVKSKA